MVGDVDRASREQGAQDAVGSEGGRASGVVGVDRVDHDGVVFRAFARSGSGVGKAARLAGVARDQLPAGAARRAVPTQLRSFGGLQSYPSRSKDPDPVDFSTGSVGIGATATLWSALAHRYVAGHFDVPQGGRQVALLGDAELDEDAVWEALVDPMVPRLGEVLWIVDLNRQSLDRVVPDIAAGRIGAMFDAAGWQTITVKYGRRLRELFARDGGRGAARAHRRNGKRGIPATAAPPGFGVAGAPAGQRSC